MHAGAPWSGGIEPAELHNVWQQEQPWPLEPGTDTHTFQEEAVHRCSKACPMMRFALQFAVDIR